MTTNRNTNSTKVKLIFFSYVLCVLITVVSLGGEWAFRYCVPWNGGWAPTGSVLWKGGWAISYVIGIFDWPQGVVFIWKIRWANISCVNWECG